MNSTDEEKQKMNTFTIKHILAKIASDYKKKTKKKLFVRVCACDLLPKTLPKDKDVIIIVNTDTSNKPGEHWELIWILNNEKHCYFFDSYGLPPTNNYIKRFIKKHAITTNWNKKQLQSFHSFCCGEYCCLFALSITKENGFNCFFNQFNENHDSNDVNVKTLFNCVFEKQFQLQGCISYLNCINNKCSKN